MEGAAEGGGIEGAEAGCHGAGAAAAEVVLFIVWVSVFFPGARW